MSKGLPLGLRIYRATIYVAAVVLVLLAITFSITRVLLHDMGKYRDVVEQQVSRLLNQKVSIQGFDARLEGITPVLIFKDVKLLHSEKNRQLASFSEARIGLSMWASIREFQLIPSEIAINGIHIAITRHKDGNISVQGLKVSQSDVSEQTGSDSQLAVWLFNYSDLILENSGIVWRDKVQGKHYDFNNVNLHLKNNGNRHVLTGQLDVPDTLGREVKFAADIEGDSLNPKDWQGKFFLQAFSVNIEQWQQFQLQQKHTRLKSGQLDLQVWGAWKDNQLTNLAGDVSAYELLFQEKKSKPFTLKMIAGLFDWQRQTQGWSAKIKDLQVIHENSNWPKTNMAVLYNQDTVDSYQLTANHLRVENVGQLLVSLGEGPDELFKILKGVKPAGDFNAFQAKVLLKEKKLHDVIVKTEFSNFNTSAWDKFPAIQGFQGSFVSTLNHGEAIFENQFSTLFFPKLFRQAFSLQQMKSHLQWKKDQYGWMVSADDIQAKTPDINAAANVYLHLPRNKKSPYMDLQVKFWDGDASNASVYFPVGIMSKGLVQWADQAIVAGDVSFGGAVFNGRLSDFPFRQQQGNFLVQFYADNVELDYQKRWPHLTNTRIDASFTGNGMYINGLQAQLLKETTSQQVEVYIKDFLKPELHVLAKTTGPTKEVFDFLVHSPIAPEARDFVSSTRFQGNSELDLSLFVPLSKKVSALKPLHYQGSVNLKKNDFFLLDNAIDIRNLQGVLNFSELGLNAKGIKAAIMGDAANLDVYTQDFKKARPIRIVGQGKLDTAILASRFDITGLDRLSGETSWQGVVTLPYQQDGIPQPARLSLSSDLQGVTISLPLPLNKAADEMAAFNMEMDFPKNDLTKMVFQYKEQLQVTLGVGHKPDKVGIVKGAINFGKAVPVLPEFKHLTVNGTAESLPVDDWVNVFQDKKSVKKGQTFDWQKLPVEIAMERLQLVKAEKEDQKNKSAIDILPQQWPLLNGYVNHLKINQTELGKVELKAERERFGFKINQLSLTAPYSTITATGYWQYRRHHETSLNLKLSSQDMGSQLSKWGYAAIIKGGKVETSSMQASWDDNPFGFEFVKLKGAMNVHIEDGNIIEVNPGAGRLFGLLSLSALPRRLFLDFADMKSGFSFDTVSGTFDIRDGNAITQNLKVESTLAKVLVNGRTGLSQQDYDLNVLVIPNISGTAALPGYLVWGPQVGAVLLFFKQLFGKEIDKSAANAYRVSGSWEKPVIEKLAGPAPEAEQ